MEEFIFTVPRDPYLSPYLAADHLLAQLPPVKMLVNFLNVKFYTQYNIKKITYL